MHWAEKMDNVIVMENIYVYVVSTQLCCYEKGRDIKIERE